MEKSQKINPFISHILQEVDEEVKKGLRRVLRDLCLGQHDFMAAESDTELPSGIPRALAPQLSPPNLRNSSLQRSQGALPQCAFNPERGRRRGACTESAVTACPVRPQGPGGNDPGQRRGWARRSGPRWRSVPRPQRHARGRLGSAAAAACGKNTTLKYLRMTGNKIENKGGMFFAAMLQINSSLQKLDLGDCDLGMQSVIAFATVLTQNQAIKGINLNRPILYGEQEESTVHLGHMLKENHCLVELHVCKHGIKNCGLQRLCNALYLNTSLRYLDVSCNKITRDGIEYLADVLKSNTTLEVIDLSFNRIENAGANYLSETLTSHNRSLKALVWFYI
ncbi:PREDICTED: leucine-rich repeat-containing protein 34 [Propithecus coquereli]|uniref:leucine-rich repeat-containing protein 34 n=1 Tax=Propithecus coquereli TaxID=379532 RepID=UPI00063F754A|nr:PREDICTED: leucine-rich repeat-containing protein 34 [Propithecus coquereli]